MTALIDMGYSGLKKIISGGQVGVDRGALCGALAFGVATGGCAPLGWRTTNGSAPELGSLYGLIEHTSPDYPPRTEENVLAGDGTLLIYSNGNSAGTVLTRKLCLKHSKPRCEIEIPFTKLWDPANNIAKVAEWVVQNEIEVLNVAGNHEKAVYHEALTFEIVIKILQELDRVGMVQKII